MTPRSLSRGETRLYAPTLVALQRSGQLPAGTRVACELAIHGKFIDVVTLSPSGVLTAFEFKQRDLRRALRQAALNVHYVDRSYVVTETTPLRPSLELAAILHVGVLEIEWQTGAVVRRARGDRTRCVDPRMRRQVRNRVIASGRVLRDALQ